MSSAFLRLAFLVLSVEGAAIVSSAQVTTGTPPFTSTVGGPVDTINPANLNVHISIPVLQKSGRGMPFSYLVQYDSSIWQPASVNGTTTWQPTNSGAFGWTIPGAGQIILGLYSVSCFSNCTYSGNFFLDALGNYHFFPGFFIIQSNQPIYPPLCGFNSSYPNGQTVKATDGSGYSIHATDQGFYSGPCVITVTGANGQQVVSTMSQALGPVSVPVATDANGNQITQNSSGQFFDTLSSTTPVLTVAGTAPSNTTFTYVAPSGANASYTMKYTQYTVQTNFGCSGVTEYGANGTTTKYLVSEIDLPDQGVDSSDRYTFTYEATPGYSGHVTGRLASVTLPSGGTITYAYSGGNNGITCADGSTATLKRYTPDTGSNYWTYAHTESGTAWTTTLTDPQGNQTVMNFQGIYPTEVQTYQGSTSGTLLNTTYTCYNGSPSPCNSTAITLPITQLAATIQWPGTNGLQSETVTSYNSYGLATERDEYAYGAGAPGSVVRKTLTNYASLGNGIVNRPAQVTVEDGSGNIKAQTTYCYDEGTPSGTTTCNAAGSPTPTSGTPQHVSITGSRGNATTIAQLVSGSTTLGKTFTYYDTGNVSVATDVNGAQTTYTYGTGSCGNSFVTSVSEPLGYSRSMTWYCIGGVQTSATDENVQTVSASYTDQYIWRPNSTTDQLNNVTTLSYIAQTSVESSLPFNGSNSAVDVLSTLDGLGRSHISQTRQSPGSTTFDSVESDYDSLGRPNRITLPYSGIAAQTNSSGPAMNETYDPLGRAAQVTDGGGGGVTYSYVQNDTYISAGPAPAGENAKRKQLEYDALGRLTSVCEITGGTASAPGGTCGQTASATGYWTQYTYDLNNNLSGVTQNAQSSTTQSRTYAYDDLGRMTTETDPETGNVAVSYTYDTDATCGTSKGDLVKKVDALGNTTCVAYDALHRLTSVTYPSGSYAAITPKRYYVYGPATGSVTVNGVAMANAKYRVAEAYTCYLSCTTKLTDEGFSYTARGEVSDIYESTPNSSGYYHVNETYWANGAVNQIGGVSGLPTVTYGVDGEGRIYSANASSGQNPLSSTTYNVASLPLQVNLGSSDNDAFTYDTNTNRITQYEFNVNGQSLIGNLTWNALGTLASLGITDPFNSSNAQTCSYSHDDLVRIASANCGSIWSQTFSYDAFGNMTKIGNPGNSFQPTYSLSTNQMTSIGGSTPGYDANGNVTNDFQHTYAWDADGRPNTIDGVGITYDALDRMVEQNRSGAYTQIVYAPSGGKLALMNESTLHMGFVPLAGGAMAVYNSSGLAYYRHADWLGSSRFASTPSRTMYSDSAYAPFGEAYAQAGTTDLSFTGMNQDTATNLYDFPAREYGTQGRWPSPDPAGIASVYPTDPQSWNRYAYVRNNSLSMTDPTGMFMSVDPCGTFDFYSLPGCWADSDFWCSMSWYGCESIFGNFGEGSCYYVLTTPCNGGPQGGGGGQPQKTQTLSCVVSSGRTTAPSPGQAPGQGALGFVPPAGSVAVDPMALGLFPGAQTNSLLGSNASQITFSFNPAPILPPGFPTTHTLGDIVGPASVRAGGSNFNGLYIFDIYGLPSLAAANAATSPRGVPVKVTVTFPSSLPINCGGPIADPVPPSPGTS